MKAKVIVICIVVMLLFSWVAIKQVWATGECSGGVYADHPALMKECLHQQTVNVADEAPYPYPDSEPYPVPVSTQVIPPYAPRQMPTEPPEGGNGH